MRHTLHASAGGRLNDPVFIIGGSRTGSEMLKTMLSASLELNLTNELYALCPRWLHRDLRADLRAHVGDLRSPRALEEVVDLVFSGRLYGWTWRHARTELDQDMLRQELAARPIDVESIVTAALVVNARLRNKPRHGAKFPVHYAYAPLLLDWYPNCKIIHTTRDPRAVYASQANKYIQPGIGAIARGWTKAKHFAHINIQIGWTARIHARLKALSPERYRLQRYEETIQDPARELTALCEFLQIEFSPAMLEPRKYGSTFDTTKGQRGVKLEYLDAWRHHVSPATLAALGALQSGAAKSLGYRFD